MPEESQVANTAPANNDDDWETAESGGFIKFDNEGDGFTGLVTAYEKKSTPKGDANSYTVITKNGQQSFYAPKDLHDKISGCVIKYGMGNFIVKARFDKKIKTASGNDFKVFEVNHKLKSDKDLEAFGIKPVDTN